MAPITHRRKPGKLKGDERSYNYKAVEAGKRMRQASESPPDGLKTYAKPKAQKCPQGQ